MVGSIKVMSNCDMIEMIERAPLLMMSGITTGNKLHVWLHCAVNTKERGKSE